LSGEIDDMTTHDHTNKTHVAMSSASSTRASLAGFAAGAAAAFAACAGYRYWSSVTCANKSVPRHNVTVEEFLAENSVPPAIQESLDEAATWLAAQLSRGRRVVVVTSGGTTVPLEANTVRFLC
jgi:hypothetical protein